MNQLPTQKNPCYNNPAINTKNKKGSFEPNKPNPQQIDPT
jgi:hypothetical protein